VYAHARTALTSRRRFRYQRQPSQSSVRVPLSPHPPKPQCPALRSANAELHTEKGLATNRVDVNQRAVLFVGGEVLDLETSEPLAGIKAVMQLVAVVTIPPFALSVTSVLSCP